MSLLLISTSFKIQVNARRYLTGYIEFCNNEYADIIEHALTNVFHLSLTSLKSYSLFERFPDACFKRMRKNVQDPITSAYLLCQCTLPTFTNFYKLLQANDPLSFRLHKVQQQSMTKLVIQKHAPSTKSLSGIRNPQFYYANQNGFFRKFNAL